MTNILINVDAPPVRPSEAVALMVHHLQLATMYFEATPESPLGALSAIADAFSPDKHQDMGLRAARAWFATLSQAYEELG